MIGARSPYTFFLKGMHEDHDVPTFCLLLYVVSQQGNAALPTAQGLGFRADHAWTRPDITLLLALCLSTKPGML